MVLDAVVSPHSKRNYPKALDDLFVFRASRASLPVLINGVAGGHGVPVTLNYKHPALGRAQDARRGQRNNMIGSEEAVSETNRDRALRDSRSAPHLRQCMVRRLVASEK
jgi:hypothetical protein